MANDSSSTAIRAANLCESLHKAFGISFQLWSPTDSWLDEKPVAPQTGRRGPIAESELLSLLTRAEPVIVNGDGSGAYTLYLPLPWGPRRSWLAVGRLSGVSKEVLERWSRTFLEAHRASLECHALEEQVGAAMNQISSDLEQQTYLRFLAEQIELCDVSRDVLHVVHRVLPRLQRVISASSIVFIPKEHADLSRVANGWVTVGTPPLDAVECLELACHFDPALFRGPVVRNQGFSSGSQELPEPVRSFMMVSVEKEGTLLGWMLAFNRLPGFMAENEIDNGFGTVEAGLLQVTSIMVATHGRNVALFQESEDLTVAVVRTLVNAIEARDSYTRGHSERVGQLGRRLARQMGLGRDVCEQTYVAGLLHDIGKIGLPDQILRKEGRLTPEEFDQIKRHPSIGFQILTGIDKLAYVLPGVLHHHERVDGAGYPAGLVGDNIPQQARILAVADSWDAMTSVRPYRQAMPFDRAEEILLEGAGSQWDESIVHLFRMMIESAKEIVRPPADAARGVNELASEPSSLASSEVFAERHSS
ncbi:HD-GYP domain-containing protein [bacterium]|nr:HD-GYP domain-containing protein [bacterium]